MPSSVPVSLCVAARFGAYLSTIDSIQSRSSTLPGSKLFRFSGLLGCISSSFFTVASSREFAVAEGSP